MRRQGRRDRPGCVPGPSKGTMDDTSVDSLPAWAIGGGRYLAAAGRRSMRRWEIAARRMGRSGGRSAACLAGPGATGLSRNPLR